MNFATERRAAFAAASLSLLASTAISEPARAETPSLSTNTKIAFNTLNAGPPPSRQTVEPHEPSVRWANLKGLPQGDENPLKSPLGSGVTFDLDEGGSAKLLLGKGKRSPVSSHDQVYKLRSEQVREPSSYGVHFRMDF